MIGLIILGLAVALTAAAVYFVFKLRLLAAFSVKKMTFGTGMLVYTAYRGKYSNLMPTINAVKGDFKRFSQRKHGSGGLRFTTFGIYYDDPQLLMDANNARAIIGGIVFDDEEDRGSLEEFYESFGEKELEYKCLKFKSFNAFGATFPLHGFLNIVSAVMRGYPAIGKFGTEKGYIKEVRCSLEIYDYPQKQLTICFPFGPEARQFHGLSGFDAPVYQPGKEFCKRD